LATHQILGLGQPWTFHQLSSGPDAVLALHGTGASSHSFLPLARCLEGQVALWAVDLPGHGASPLAPGFRPTRTALAASLGAALAAFSKPWSLAVGHSASAAILAEWALAPNPGVPRPPLAFLAPALTPLTGLRRWVFPAAARFFSLQPRWLTPSPGAGAAEKLAERLVADTGSRVPPAQLEGYAKLLREPAHLAGALAMMRHWDLRSLGPRLRQLPVPVRVLWGDRDRTYLRPPEVLFGAKLPQASWVTFPGLGHLLHEEAPARVAPFLALPWRSAERMRSGL